MNKNEILNTLEKYNFDKNQIYIISGSAMVLQGIKEKTSGIDITVSSEYEAEILKKYECIFEKEINDNGQKYKIYMLDNIINFSVHYYEKYSYFQVEKYNVQTPEDILKLKEKLNRKKDQEDIASLKKYINGKNINSLSMAYLGDAIYELYVRMHLINTIKKVGELQKEATNYVSAKSQSKYLDQMLKENFLTKEEIEIVKRARNHKSHASKSTDIITYKKSTGLEALIGYLKIKGNEKIIKKIMNYIVGD